MTASLKFSRDTLGPDLGSGLTVALVSIPEGMASVGGSPQESVLAKTGVTEIEPDTTMVYLDNVSVKLQKAGDWCRLSLVQ